MSSMTDDDVRDAARAELQGRILGYLDDQEANEPEFAGCVIDEQRDSDTNRLLAIRIVFCDVIDENVARRV